MMTNEIGRVLIKCTRNARERIGFSNVYRYLGDVKAEYGTA